MYVCEIVSINVYKKQTKKTEVPKRRFYCDGSLKHITFTELLPSSYAGLI